MSLTVSPSGEAQFWSSVNDWLAANVPATTDFTYFFDQALDPAVMPQVEASQFNFFEPGDTALGMEIFPKNPAGHTQGRLNEAILELNIRDDGSRHPDALQKVRLLRDAFVYALTNAGVADDNGAVIKPPIIVYDALGASTNTFARVMTEAANCIVKNFYKPEPPQTQIFRYQLLFKMQWVELV